jgi:hypothetical protein
MCNCRSEREIESSQSFFLAVVTWPVVVWEIFLLSEEKFPSSPEGRRRGVCESARILGRAVGQRADHGRWHCFRTSIHRRLQIVRTIMARLPRRQP